jgi:hypothetical protein
MGLAAWTAVSGDSVVSDPSALDDELSSGTGSDGITLSFATRADVSGGTAISDSSALGDELSSLAGVGVANADVRSGVSMVIGSEDGVGVGSAIGVALT